MGGRMIEYKVSILANCYPHATGGPVPVTQVNAFYNPDPVMVQRFIEERLDALYPDQWELCDLIEADWYGFYQHKQGGQTPLVSVAVRFFPKPETPRYSARLIKILKGETDDNLK
jgi:hypothetical protein